MALSAYRAWTRERAARPLGALAQPPPSISLPGRVVAIYVQWVRWMVGAEEGPWGPGSAMRAADQLYAQESAAVRQAAKELWRAMGPHLWPTGAREVYRGLRLDDPSLDGKLLPWSTSYAVPTVSFSEDARVACYFADPGKLGMPAADPFGGPRTLPPHGYVVTLSANGKDVLFHWRYVLGVAPLFGLADPRAEVPDILLQQEVTIRNYQGLVMRCHDFHRFCKDYVTHRYGGVWQAGVPDPFGPGWVG